jgi:hypothetical protein
MFLRANFQLGVETTALKVLRKYYPSTALPDSKLGDNGFIMDVVGLAGHSRDFITESEAVIRTAEFKKKENLGNLPEPWLASLMLKAQTAAQNQADGTERANVWRKLIHEIPESKASTEYSKQLSKLKNISRLMQGVSEFIPAQRFTNANEFNAAKIKLNESVEALDLALSLPKGYERTTALIITSLEYLKTVEKLKSHEVFKYENDLKRYDQLQSIADELVLEPQVPNTVLKKIWDFVQTKKRQKS